MNAPAVKKSTIVRSLRAAFFLLERFAPERGSVLAERLWCTVPKGRVRPFTTPGRRRDLDGIAVETWGEGPAVYLMHGWGGWRGQLDSFVQPLLDSGFRVIALDAPSHGDSRPGMFGEGRGLLTEFSDALRAAVAEHGPARAVIAHSLGGAATMIAALDGLPVERVVTIGAMADPIPYTRAFAQTLGFGERIRTGFLRRLERRVGLPMAHFDIPARAQGRSGLPDLLIFHDKQDKEVRVSDATRLVAAWSNSTLVLSDGLGHRRILADPDTILRTIAFTGSPAPASAPAPSFP